MGIKTKEWFLENNKIIILILIALLFLFSWVGFVFTPMTGDIKVFMASANQSKYLSDNLIVGA